MAYDGSIMQRALARFDQAKQRRADERQRRARKAAQGHLERTRRAEHLRRVDHIRGSAEQEGHERHDDAR